MNTTRDWLPLFPLDLALLPGAFLPLHIFEPRYRELTRRSLEGDRRFGVVRMHGGQLAPIGCTARIMEVLQTYPDGRSDILIRGEERFSPRDLREHADGYWEARTEAVCDEAGPGPDAEDRLLLERLFRDYAQLADDGDLLSGALSVEAAEHGSGSNRGDMADARSVAGTIPEGGSAFGKDTAAHPDTASADATASSEDTASSEATPSSEATATADADRFSFALAVRMPLGVEEQQALLATLSERERTVALLGHLARLVPRLRAHEKDRRKVKGNGKLVPAEE